MNSTHRNVSSESEELILVDRDDNEVGFLSKSRCHDGAGVLHRAFSLFLFNGDGELLLQQRSSGKRLWPGFWSNSICSHPRRGETMELATMRRLSDELNFETSLEYVYRFCYTAEFTDVGAEKELCHVYLGRIPGDVHPNDSEIASIRYVPANAVENEIAANPDSFTPWFKQEWRALVADHREQLTAYCDLD